ncbi:glycosyltransferase family 4 protein [Priestia megaterium]|uniref:glycosyltransferase family 4 protein n=1 Tax=Priestia megaterium TaxID=1404 RepID=UPI00189F4B78|nr:glycosyltransferase family 4 protein [Priestia megaterium]
MKQKESICIIGQFPPPVHGLSTALKTIIDSEHMKDKYSITFIDIKENKKFFNNLMKIRQNDSDLYYFTISQSTFGNLRDMIILNLLISKNKKVIIHYHGGYYKTLYEKMSKFQKRLNKKLISRIDIMIALGESLKKMFSDVIDSSKIRVCENYVENSSLADESSINKKIAAYEYKSKIEVLYLSNFIKSKGYLDVLHAAKDLRGENISFHFAGAFFNKQDEDEFMQFINNHELQEYVYYHGIVKGKDKKELLINSDVFVLPTYYTHEGQPISIIEAMGNGLTIITTNHGGIKDIVEKDNGYIIEPKSPHQIVQSLKDLAENKNKMYYYGKNNRGLVLEKFKEIDYIQRLEKIFDEVIHS